MSGTQALFERIKYISNSLIAANKFTDAFNEGEGSKDAAPQVGAEKLADEKVELLKLAEDQQGNELSSDHADQDVALTAFGDQISYVHNEYNFDGARPLKNFALVTHISFLPIYPPTPREGLENSIAPEMLGADRLSDNILMRFRELRTNTIQFRGRFFWRQGQHYKKHQ